MKKLYIVAALAAFVVTIDATSKQQKQQQAMRTKQAKTRRNNAPISPEIERNVSRTKEERDAYLDQKLKSGHRRETPEFRFALKVSENKEKLHRKEISQEEYNLKIGKKIQVYIEKLQYKDVLAGLDFINEFLGLSLREMKARVGTREMMGSMQRYVD